MIRSMTCFVMLITVCMLSGCAGSPLRQALLPQSTAKEPNTAVVYIPKQYNPTPEQRKQFTDLKLRYETLRHEYGGTKLVVSGFGQIADEYPDAAKFAIENKIFDHSADDNSRRNLTEQALRTLVSSGQFEYLETYWDNMLSESRSSVTAVDWYDLKFALAASDWVSEHRQNTATAVYAQHHLLSYWRHGCKQSLLTAERRKASTHIFDSDCAPSPAKVEHYFMAYQENDRTRFSEKVRTAVFLGDTYFIKKQYSAAAGWYGVAAMLIDSNPDMSLPTGGNTVVNYPAGKNINDLIEIYGHKKVVAYMLMHEQCLRRLKLIRDSGVATLEAI